jgi:hypothetical protein
MKKLLALSLSVALLGAGCSGGLSETSSGTTVAVDEQSSGATFTGDHCENAYFPSDVGREVTYSIRVAGKDYQYTQRVIAKDDKSLKLEFLHNGIAILEQDVACDAGSINMKNVADIALALEGVKVDVDITNQEGVYLPATLDIGDEWRTNTDFSANVLSGRLFDSGVKEYDQSTLIKNKVVAKEKITVAAGSFDAVKVEQIGVTVSRSVKSRYPETNSLKMFLWFVEGIGMVKAESTTGYTTIISGSAVGKVEAISIKN